MPKRSLQELESKTREWLTTLGTSFLDSRAASDSFRSNVDFLVTQPFSFAVEVFEGLTRATVKTRSKRLLAKRINLALAFSTSLPLIGVVPDDSDVSEIPFIDAVFHASNLPDLKRLSGIRCDTFVSRILTFDGEPELKFSTEEELCQNWKDLLSLEEILRNDDWKSGTLAKTLHDFATDLAERNQAEDSNPSLPFRPSLSIESRFAASPRFEKIWREWIASHVPATESTLRIKLEVAPYTEIRFATWKNSFGTEFVVRRLTAEERSLAHKSKELLADAWLLKSLFGFRTNQLMVVVLPESPWFRSSIVGRRINVQKIATVNSLEAAGWTVFPSDFGVEAPAFISHMQGASAHE
jgi:hypothetical protein